eukprot:gene33796-13058_t
MLGAIALVSASRTLDAYVQDLRDKGQDDRRIEQVTAALRPLAEC